MPSLPSRRPAPVPPYILYKQKVFFRPNRSRCLLIFYTLSFIDYPDISTIHLPTHATHATHEPHEPHATQPTQELTLLTLLNEPTQPSLSLSIYIYIYMYIYMRERCIGLRHRFSHVLYIVQSN